jgi:hypothetical protein
MGYRKLRIAWSVALGLVAVLLCVLWVRSYWWKDSARCPLTNVLIDPSVRKYAVQTINGEQSIHVSQVLIIKSFEGRLTLRARGQNLDAPGWFRSYWGVTSYGYKDLRPRRNERQLPAFGYGFDLDGRYIRFPYLLPVVLCATFATIPWLPLSRRFSLRALLFATTLVAILLGAIVYAVK